MKVLCITDSQDRPETELFVRLSRQLDTLTVMSNPIGRNYTRLVDAGVQVIPLQIKSRFDKQGTAAIKAELERGDYDIAHAFNTRALACLLRAGKRHRAKLLAYRGVTTGVSYLKPESWTTFLSPRLDGVFCNAAAVRHALINTRLLWLRFPAHKAKTIYKGHDPDWYDCEPVSPSEFGIPDDAKTICCISRNSAKKGIHTLLDAFDQLAPGLNAHLLLIGSVDKNEAVRKRVSQSPNVDRIHFAGYRNDAIAIIRGADLLVSASESGEGLPRVVIEAMCVGTPVVATDAGGTAELFKHNNTGLLIPQRSVEKLTRAINQTIGESKDTVLRTNAAKAMITQEFNADDTTNNTMHWYQDILKNE